jgi:hypothetical protein
MLDRVLEAPSVWLMSIFPILMWLNLHRDDGLVHFIFEQTPRLKEEFKRLYSLIEQFTTENRIGTYLPKASHKDAEKHELMQLELVELMGSSLIFEENYLIGFLPLKSYFDQKKQINSGKKCPEDKQDTVRCLLMRDALDYLGCKPEKT